MHLLKTKCGILNFMVYLCPRECVLGTNLGPPLPPIKLTRGHSTGFSLFNLVRRPMSPLSVRRVRIGKEGRKEAAAAMDAIQRALVPPGGFAGMQASPSPESDDIYGQPPRHFSLA